MTSCIDIKEELKAFADGELAGLDSIRVHRHVDSCGACKRELEEIQSLGRTLRNLDTAMPRPELRVRILSEIPQSERIPPPVRVPWWRMPALGLGTAAVALLILVAVGPRTNRMPEDLEIARESAAPSPEALPAIAPPSGEKTSNLPPPVRAKVALPRASDPESRAPQMTDSLSPAAAAKSRIAARPSGTDSVRATVPEMETLIPAEPSRKEKSYQFGSSAGRSAAIVAAERPDSPKADALIAAPAQTPSVTKNAPAGPQAPPAGGAGMGGGFGAAPAGLPADGRFAEKQRNRRLPQQNTQGMLFSLEPNPIRTEVIEVVQPDVGSVANGIIEAVQDEGGKPLAPEKLAEAGASEVVVTLLVPASRLDEIKAMFTESKVDRFARGGQRQYQNLGAFRARDLTLKTQAENNVYFGYLAPTEKQVTEGAGGRSTGGVVPENMQFRQQSEQRISAREQDAAKVAKPASAAIRPSVNRAAVRGVDTAARLNLKKESEEVIRLIVKVRAPPKQAPASKRGNE